MKPRRRTKNEVILRDFAVTNLLWERVSSGINVDPQTERGELALDLDGVVVLQDKRTSKNARALERQKERKKRADEEKVLTNGAATGMMTT